MPPTILVVEDETTTIALLRYLLEREGYEIVHAEDGQQALAILHTMAPPALVLLDVGLPDLNGLELVTLIRHQPGWQAVSIVMLTADATERDIVRALDAGANDYVAKPFSAQPLMARLRRLLAARSSATREPAQGFPHQS